MIEYVIHNKIDKPKFSYPKLMRLKPDIAKATGGCNVVILFTAKDVGTVVVPSDKWEMGHHSTFWAIDNFECCARSEEITLRNDS
jgi:hypothetical protein